MNRLTTLILALCVGTLASTADAQLIRCLKKKQCRSVCAPVVTDCCVAHPVQLESVAANATEVESILDEPSVARGDVSKQLIGTWRLEESRNPGSPSGIGTRLKMFTETHFCVIQPDPDSGEIVFQHGGPYEFDGAELHETIQFAGDSTSSLIGRTFTHQIEVSGDVLKQIDSEGVYNETWHRAKHEDVEE